MSKLVLDGKLTVPLFHGTSTLFYESIRSAGLGAKDLVGEIGVRRAIQEVLNYEEQLQRIPNWDFEKPLLLRIAEVDKNPTGSFLRYCGTYVTPSRRTAATYATLNGCGSEALACTVNIIKLVVAQLPDLACQEPFANVLAFAEKPASPILVEALDVPIVWLRSERGEPIETVLPQIERALDDPDIYDLLVQQENFELVHPIAPAYLRFYEIVRPRSRKGSVEDLELATLP